MKIKNKIGLPCHHCGAHYSEVVEKCIKKCSLRQRIEWQFLVEEHNRMVNHNKRKELSKWT